MVSGQDIKPWLREDAKGYIFTNANVVDVASGNILSNATVIVSDGKIESVTQSPPEESASSHVKINCEGKFLCPGLFDAHVHMCAVPGFNSLASAFCNPHDVSLLRQPYVASQMLHRGFTSVRDCGGALLALKEAIEDGVFPGPRLFLSVAALSQTGGHSDLRSPHDCCGGHRGELGSLCNGVPECMAAVRNNIRCGADFIKIMGSGGVSSPTDKLEHLQFTPSEIQAMVECADNAGTFVTAHAYTTKAIRHCIDNGVRGIEHGNFIDEDTAKLMVAKGVWLTPTLITYDQMQSSKWEHYLPPESKSKNAEVYGAGLQALKVADEAGVNMCFGTDLLGPLGSAQTVEFVVRSKVLSPLTILRSATVNPAKMMGLEDTLGQIKQGFAADILILEKNPLDDITILDDPEKNLLGVLKEGRVYKSRWQGIQEDAGIPVRVKG